MPDIINVEFSQLSKADIIFTTSSSPESVGIRKAINSIISHTILVIDYNKIIEAITPNVREATWDRALEHAEATVAIVMRRKGLASGADQDKVVAQRHENLTIFHTMFTAQRVQVCLEANKIKC